MSRLFQHPGYMSALQLAIDHDDDACGITFDIYDPNTLGNSSASGGSLSSGAYILWIIGRKYLKIHNVTNPDKLKLVEGLNYNRKYAIPKFSKCKILVGKMLMIQHALVKFVGLFHRQSFILYGTIF